MAGFQVIIYGRFWVFTEDLSPSGFHNHTLLIDRDRLQAALRRGPEKSILKQHTFGLVHPKMDCENIVRGPIRWHRIT